MMLPPRLARCGFTLIELLVVIAIIGSLLGMTSLSFRPSRESELRQAAQSLASLLLQTQSLALGNDAGAAVTLSSTAVHAADLSSGISANVTSGSITSGTTATITIDLDPVTTAYRARFVPKATTSGTAMPASAWYTTTSGTSLFFDASQTVENTIWPVWMYTGDTPQCAVEYLVRPTASVSLYKWPRLATIDFRYSGFSGEPAGLTPDVAIRFSPTGQPQTLFSGFAVREITSTLYLLIAAATDIASDSSLQTDQSIWVALDPDTGNVTIARNFPSDDLEVARSNIYARPGLAR
jgi:prepilin-type N-terminal cleavage/methylation domain-containing protein